MRWFRIDRFVEFERGKRAVTVKNVSLSEEHIHDHVPGCPVMPASLIIEGMAQTGGILLAEACNFKRMVVLAKVPKITFHGFATPGDTIRYYVEMMQETDDGGIVSCKGMIGDQVLCEGEICFAFLEAGGAEMSGSSSAINALATSGLSSILKVGQHDQSFQPA